MDHIVWKYFGNQQKKVGKSNFHSFVQSIVSKYFLFHGNIQEILWKYSGNKISILWKRFSFYSGNVFDTLSKYVQDIVETFTSEDEFELMRFPKPELS